MSKIKKFLRSPAATVLMFFLAATMLLFSTIGGTRAALTYYSENYSSRVQMYDIGVTLVENGREIAWRNYDSRSRDGSWDEKKGALLENILPEGESFQLGRNYDVALTVKNSGTIDQYVRVSIYKYWLDETGENKLRELSPELIDLHLINEGVWQVDKESSTEERTVLYYSGILGPGETTPALSDTLKVDGMVASKVTKTETNENGQTTITTTYDYDGVQFRVEATVDAVQTHNAEDAIWSAWGRKVNIGSDGSLKI